MRNFKGDAVPFKSPAKGTLSLWNPMSHLYIPHKGGYKDEEGTKNTLFIGKESRRKLHLYNTAKMTCNIMVTQT